jgi:hypothetical protein
MTTAIVLDLTLALGLGLFLIGISITVSGAIFALGGQGQRLRRHGLNSVRVPAAP